MAQTFLPPDEIIALIDQIGPALKREDEGGEKVRPFVIDVGVHGGSIQVIVELVDRLPQSMYPSDTEAFRDFIISMMVIKNALENWQNRRGAQQIAYKPYTQDINPVSLLRRTLRQFNPRPIPDWVDELDFVTNNDLRTDLRADIASVKSCIDDSSWKAACVLAGSALEALLHDHHTARINDVKAKIISNKLGLKADKINNWGLADHLDIAVHLGALQKYTIDTCQVLREYRNLIHPGKAERKKIKATQGKATTSLGVLITAIENLKDYANSHQSTTS